MKKSLIGRLGHLKQHQYNHSIHRSRHSVNNPHHLSFTQLFSLLVDSGQIRPSVLSNTFGLTEIAISRRLNDLKL
jgi:hypothetical protein